MRIDHYNTYPHGGAAAAARRLHRTLRARNIDSRLFYTHDHQNRDWGDGVEPVQWEPTTQRGLNPFANMIEKRRRRRIHRQYDMHLAARDAELEVFSMADLPNPTRLDPAIHRADLVHLHWISFLADYPSFFRSIDRTVPIVWTLHDMNPFTGGCHYSSGCVRFRKKCGVCPQVVSPSPDDVSRSTWETKRSALRGRRVAVVGPSRWIVELARSSPIWPHGTEFHHIRLGFELDEFRPIDRQLARRRLGLDTEKVLLGFGADNVQMARKGFEHLLKSLERVRSDRPFECVVLGAGEIPETYRLLPPMHSVGYLSSNQQLAEFYSACDFVVVPSVEDNQPQIGLEAMACGTPVLAFNAGGIPEYVIDGETGVLVEVGNREQLASAIERMIKSPELRRRLSRGARRWVETNGDCESIAEQYLALYRDLTTGGRRRHVA